MKDPLLQPRFEYDKVERFVENGKHHYLTPEGKLPSVTTILSDTMPEHKKIGLKKWKDKIGPGEARTILECATEIGTAMHFHLEEYIKGIGVHPDETIPFNAEGAYLAENLLTNGIIGKVDEVWGTEAPLYYPGVYAGTADCVGVHLGEPAIIDFKTSKRRKTKSYVSDYFLQLAAYSLAHNALYGTDINKGVIMMEVWDCETPEYQEWVIDGEEFRGQQLAWSLRVKEYYEKKRQ